MQETYDDAGDDEELLEDIDREMTMIIASAEKDEDVYFLKIEKRHKQLISKRWLFLCFFLQVLNIISLISIAV